MKVTVFIGCSAALALMLSGCYTPPPPPMATQPPGVIYAPPPPAVAVEPPAVAPAPPPPTGYVTYAPEYYTWDGNEYVGFSNGQYVYWTGGAWIIAPPIIIGHFHGWERYHPDWRRHATRYRPERFR